MKKIYWSSIKILTVVFFLNCFLAQAQLKIIAIGNFNISGVSDNGIVNVDNRKGKIYKWDATNGMVSIGALTNEFPQSERNSKANAVNADGTVIVGWQEQSEGTKSGAKWTNGTESFILDNNGDKVGEARAVSADGNTIIGSAMPNPYVWNAFSGLTYITHPNSSAFFRGGATGISGNGELVIGFFRPFPGLPMAGEGFIWTAATGRTNLNAYAASLGIETNGVKMSLPSAISKDGKKIAGTGVNASNQIVAFYLDLTRYLAANDLVANENISIYPNPVKDVIHIEGKSKIDKAEIYNMVGQKIKTFSSVESRIDVSSLSKGNYVLQLFVKGEVSQRFKFIKH